MKREDIIERIEGLRKINEDDTVRPEQKETNRTFIKYYKQKLIDKEYEV